MRLVLVIAMGLAACSRDSSPSAVGEQTLPIASAAASTYEEPPLATNEQLATGRALCDKGVYKGCALVGWAHYTGEGAPLDHKIAHEYFKRACEHGEPAGCVPLGYMYQRGQVVPKDLERAISLFKDPCERGEAKVCIGLGELYEVEKSDPRSALVFYGKACDWGEPDGCAAEQRLNASKL